MDINPLAYVIPIGNMWFQLKLQNNSCNRGLMWKNIDVKMMMMLDRRNYAFATYIIKWLQLQNSILYTCDLVLVIILLQRYNNNYNKDNLSFTVMLRLRCRSCSRGPIHRAEKISFNFNGTNKIGTIFFTFVRWRSNIPES